ncbi:MAG: hypothetical protein LW635_15175 [Microcystis sp. 53598_E5]|nr:hypothetical protein [Microcystis sp. 53598_E5]MCE2674893.1 hypothetical protein [Microcystis sp. 53598_E5]
MSAIVDKKSPSRIVSKVFEISSRYVSTFIFWVKAKAIAKLAIAFYVD